MLIVSRIHPRITLEACHEPSPLMSFLSKMTCRQKVLSLASRNRRILAMACMRI